MSVWNETTAILGSALATMLDVFDPDIVLLGGGVTKVGDQLLGPVRSIAHAEAMTPAAREVPIELAALGQHLSVVAAAAVAFEHFEGVPRTAGADA